MKILLGHPKDQESESPELRAMGLRYNKAAPSAISLVGLYTVYQPGYGSYMAALPAFIAANEKQKKEPLYRMGYPITCTEVFPVPNPPISIRVKSPNEALVGALKGFDYKEIRESKGPTRTYIVTPGRNVVKALTPFADSKHFPAAGHVDINGYAQIVLVHRIISGFLRAHKYPAFSNHSDGDSITTQTRKRLIDEGPGAPKPAAKRGGRGRSHAPGGEEDIAMEDVPTSVRDDNITLRFAKPQDTTVAAWGFGFNDVPRTEGIVFPFIPALASWDKDTIPNLIEKHFLRCLGVTDKQILTQLNRLNVEWRRCCYNTTMGVILSHLGKVIEVAIPAQARVFPVFESGVYKGSYLSGSRFSVGHKGEIIRPVSFDDNTDDLNSMLGRSRFLQCVRDSFVGDSLKKDFDDEDFQTLRQVHNWVLDKTMPDNQDLIKMQSAAVEAGFQTTYWTPTPKNIKLAITYALKEEEIPDDTPMHHAAFLSIDPLTIALSAFGPLVPSPHIPGGKEIKDFDDVPMNSTCCFRRCALGSAVQEWKEFIHTGIVRNEPRNLNARFQYTQVRGTENKKEWYQTMKDIKGMKQRSGGENGSDDEGGVQIHVGVENEDEEEADLFADM
jgi:hypothetical protein